MNSVVKKSKMTLDKFATMTQREFLAVRKDMVTKSDLKEELKYFATKDDLKHFATKDDLKHFATKDDLKHFATKDDLKAFATKNDLKYFATHEDLKELKHELKQDIQHGTVDVLRAVDKIMDRFDTAEKDHAADKLFA